MSPKEYNLEKDEGVLRGREARESRRKRRENLQKETASQRAMETSSLSRGRQSKIQFY